MVAAAEAAGDAPAPGLADRSRAGADLSAADLELDARVMPPEALQLGAEAQSRFLKAKVRVLQEELDKAAADVKRLVCTQRSLMLYSLQSTLHNLLLIVSLNPL